MTTAVPGTAATGTVTAVPPSFHSDSFAHSVRPEARSTAAPPSPHCPGVRPYATRPTSEGAVRLSAHAEVRGGAGRVQPVRPSP